MGGVEPSVDTIFAKLLEKGLIYKKLLNNLNL